MWNIFLLLGRIKKITVCKILSIVFFNEAFLTIKIYIFSFLKQKISFFLELWGFFHLKPEWHLGNVVCRSLSISCLSPEERVKKIFGCMIYKVFFPSHPSHRKRKKSVIFATVKFFFRVLNEKEKINKNGMKINK